MVRCGRVLIGVLGLLLAACGGDGLPHTALETVLTVWNRSQFELLELRVHDRLDYSGAANLLSAPLAVEERFDVDFVQGQYVTVIRRKVEVGETIAFTTERGVDTDEHGCTLIVFDEAFRLLRPQDDLQ